MAKATTVATNLLDRIIQPSPLAPYAWGWTRETRGETLTPINLATRARIVAVYTETETTGDRKGTVMVKVVAEALDGTAEGQLAEMYVGHFLMVPEAKGDR